MNTVNCFQAKVTFRGRPTIELLPVSDWRELLKAGQPMRWYAEISGLALVGGQVVHAECRINGIGLNENGEVPDLVEGLATVGYGLKPAKGGHSVQCFTRDAGNGRVEFADRAGNPSPVPVISEAQVVGDDGQPIDLGMGHRYLVQVDPALTVELSDVDCQHKVDQKTGQPVFGKEGKAYVRLFATARRAVPALVAEAPKGKGLGLGHAKVIAGYSREAARATAHAAAALRPADAPQRGELEIV